MSVPKKLFAVALTLRQDSAGAITMKPILSWRVTDTKESAIGSSVIWASDKFPGWSVSSSLCTEIPQEAMDLVATQGEQHDK